MKYRILATFAVVVFGLTLAGNALASSNNSDASVSLYRPFPGGIDPNNPQHALQQVESRAAWDKSYANVIAQQAGRPAYIQSEYRAEGYAAHASRGTTNSGVTGSGQVVPVTDHNGSQNVKVFEMINIVSEKTVEVMVRCGNPRLRPSVSIVVIPWKPFKKGTVIRFNRKVSKPVSITCPSGQRVSGKLTTTVTGFTRASTWGKVQGSLNLKLRLKLKIQVKSWVSLHCGPAPKPAPPPTPPPAPAGSCNVNNSPGAVVCSSFYVIVTCGGAQITITGSTAAQALSEANQYVANNCSSSSPPPSSPPPPPPPPSKPSHHCTASVGSLQKDERTATFSVTCDGPIASAIWTFSGNGAQATGTSVNNTFPDSSAGGSGTGTVTVYFSDGADSVTTSTSINIPAPPPDNNPAPPPITEPTG